MKKILINILILNETKILYSIRIKYRNIYFLVFIFPLVLLELPLLI